MSVLISFGPLALLLSYFGHYFSKSFQGSRASRAKFRSYQALLRQLKNLKKQGELQSLAPLLRSYFENHLSGHTASMTLIELCSQMIKQHALVSPLAEQLAKLSEHIEYAQYAGSSADFSNKNFLDQAISTINQVNKLC